MQERHCISEARQRAWQEGIDLAAELIDSGKALATLKTADRSQQPAGGRGMTILDQLAEHARERVSEAKRKISPKDLKQQALSMQKGSFAFEKALRKDRTFLSSANAKKRHHSKGLIAPEFPYLQIAEEYEAAGADCISVLTEPKWFLGSDEYLKEIADAVSDSMSSQGFHGRRIYDL